MNPPVVIRERPPTAEESEFGRQDRQASPLPRLWFAGEVRWEELAALLERYHVEACVIDSQPEGLKAREFAAQAGRVRPGFYVSGMSDAEIAEFAAGPRRSSLQGGGDA